MGAFPAPLSHRSNFASVHTRYRHSRSHLNFLLRWGTYSTRWVPADEMRVSHTFTRMMRIALPRVPPETTDGLWSACVCGSSFDPQQHLLKVGITILGWQANKLSQRSKCFLKAVWLLSGRARTQTLVPQMLSSSSAHNTPLQSVCSNPISLEVLYLHTHPFIWSHLPKRALLISQLKLGLREERGVKKKDHEDQTSPEFL